MVHVNWFWFSCVVAPVGTACDVVRRADSGEVVMAGLGRLARMHQDTDQRVSLVANSETCLCLNGMVDLDNMFFIQGSLEAVVVDKEDLHETQ